MSFRSSKKWAILIGLALLGAGYFGTFSNLEVNFILKQYLAMMPLQLGVLVYLLWIRRDRESSNKITFDD